MNDSKSGDRPPGAGPKGQFAPKGTLVMEAVPPKPAPSPPVQPFVPPAVPPAAPVGYAPQAGHPPQAGHSPQAGYPPQAGHSPQAGYPPQPLHAQHPQAWQPAPPAAAGAMQPVGAWPGAAQARGHGAGWQAGAVVVGVPTQQGGTNPRLPVSGDHWPLPEALLHRLPQLPIVQALEPHDAEVHFSGSGSAIDWLTYAAEVNERDNEAERIKKQLFIWGMVCLIGGVLTIPLFGVGLVPIGISIYLFLRRRKFNKIDVDDRRLEAFTGTLRTLAPELKANKPLNVELDFTAHTRHVRSSAQNASEYEQQWLSLKLPLQDGSHAQMTITVQVKERRKPKRKYTKIKLKQREQVVVRLTPASGKTFSPNPRAHQTAGRVVNGLTLRQALVEPNQACFTWSSWVSTNVRARGGWVSHAPPLDSRHLVSTLIVSYKLARAAELEAA